MVSSLRALDNLCSLIYGKPERYKNIGFHSKMEQFNLPPPILHSVLLNRSTQYGNKPSAAFIAILESIKKQSKIP